MLNEELYCKHNKEELFSFRELKEHAFASVYPSIFEQLGCNILAIEKGKNADDVDYYLTGDGRTIGVKLKIDAYPDIYDVGKYFGETKENKEYVKEMHEKGYEFAVATVGLGSKNPDRFRRRVFLKKDNYNVTYEKLHFIKYRGEQSSDIRYSLSLAPEDESWKGIAGFEYVVPKKIENPNSVFMLQKSDDGTKEEKRRIESENWHTWNDKEEYTRQIGEYLQKAGIQVKDFEFHCDLFEYMAVINWYVGSVEEVLDYFFNAVDFVCGKFLKDGPDIVEGDILTILKRIAKHSELMKNHETIAWRVAAYNYVVYKYCTDFEFVKKCVAYKKSVLDGNGDGRYHGLLLDTIQREFIEDPVMFGYDNSLKERLKNLQEMNCPEFFPVFDDKKGQIREKMVKFHRVHSEIIDRKEILKIRDYQLPSIEMYDWSVVELEEFIKCRFDEKLPEHMKRKVESFLEEVCLCRESMQYDVEMVAEARAGNMKYFAWRKAVKESKKKFKAYLDSKNER